MSRHDRCRGWCQGAAPEVATDNGLISSTVESPAARIRPAAGQQGPRRRGNGHVETRRQVRVVLGKDPPWPSPRPRRDTAVGQPDQLGPAAQRSAASWPGHRGGGGTVSVRSGIAVCGRQSTTSTEAARRGRGAGRTWPPAGKGQAWRPGQGRRRGVRHPRWQRRGMTVSPRPGQAQGQLADGANIRPWSTPGG